MLPLYICAYLFVGLLYAIRIRSLDVDLIDKILVSFLWPIAVVMRVLYEFMDRDYKETIELRAEVKKLKKELEEKKCIRLK